VLKILKGEKNDEPVGFLEEIKWTVSCSSTSIFFFFFFYLKYFLSKSGAKVEQGHWKMNSGWLIRE
jgi:hypothetical protein